MVLWTMLRLVEHERMARLVTKEQAVTLAEYVGMATHKPEMLLDARRELAAEVHRLSAPALSRDDVMARAMDLARRVAADHRPLPTE